MQFDGCVVKSVPDHHGRETELLALVHCVDRCCERGDESVSVSKVGRCSWTISQHAWNGGTKNCVVMFERAAVKLEKQCLKLSITEGTRDDECWVIM